MSLGKTLQINPFEHDGVVTKIELHVGNADRHLNIGVYRPLGGDGHFQLVKEIKLPAGSLQLGKYTVSKHHNTD